MVCDRATLFNLLIYIIFSGVINEELKGKNMFSVPLDAEDYMEIGYITNNKTVLGKFAALYIDILKKHTEEKVA